MLLPMAEMADAAFAQSGCYLFSHKFVNFGEKRGM
jgi:hypothetical protein